MDGLCHIVVITRCWSRSRRECLCKSTLVTPLNSGKISIDVVVLSRICWPFEADQPANAANITFVHGAGYELFEVRSGHGLRPIHRLGDKTPAGTLEAIRQEANDLLTKARGEDGQAKRRKAQWFSEQFAKNWEEGGVAWQELKKFVESLH